MVPCPEIITAGAGLPFCRTERSRSMPLPSGRRTSNRNASARSASGCTRNSRIERHTAMP
jgi:hypothetical protein